jgi:hypothetical protein
MITYEQRAQARRRVRAENARRVEATNRIFRTVVRRHIILR